MRRVRRLVTVLLCLALLAVPTLPARAARKDEPALPAGGKTPAAKDDKKDETAEAIQLPTDSRLRKKLDAAQDYMKEESWGEAARILQSLLDAEQDAFVRVPRKNAADAEVPAWLSVKAEAERLLGSLPAQGRQEYERLYGPDAAALLKEAKEKQDDPLFAQGAHRFLWTQAGGEALRLLASRRLVAGQFAAAANSFARLLRRQDLATWPPETLFDATRAFRQVGDDNHAEQTWHRLKEHARGGNLRIGDQVRTLAEWEAESRKAPHAPPAGSGDWPFYRGDPGRSGQGKGDRPFAAKRWAVPTMKGDAIQNLVLDQAVKQAEGRDRPVLPAFFPVAAGGKVAFRTYEGVIACDLETGKPAWEAYPEGGLERLLDPQVRGAGNKAQWVMQWADAYMKMGKPEMLYENSIVGTLSTDGSRLYIIDDLFLPPFDPTMPGNGAVRPNGRPQPLFGSMRDAAYHNRLNAYDLHNGKLKWNVGAGDGKEEKKAGQAQQPGADEGESYFLGPPLPLQGKLYVLAQNDQDLRLVCLEPATGEVDWAQALAATQARLSQDFNRRTWAAHLAYGEGVLVCPTNAGMLVGVDVLSHALVWAHPYREPTPAAAPTPLPPGVVRPVVPAPAPLTGSAWKVTAPVIAGRRVVFTAPDSTAVRCLNLGDGSLAWKSPKGENDLYLAGVFRGKVLIVGHKECRALSLGDGSPLWRLVTGTPSGQGVAAGSLYYLPLKEGKGGEPEVCVIDVDKGRDIAHIRSHRYEPPGNLMLYEGDVLSQTVQEMAAFPQLKVKREQMDERLGKNPQDPVGLTDRSDVRLANGDLAGAIDDLRTALRNNPSAEARASASARLYEALTDYLRADFDAAEKDLYEYRALCRVDTEPGAPTAEKQKAATEQGRRLARYHWLVAEGREKQGRLTEALESYLESAAQGNRKELVESAEDRGVKAPAAVLARGRVSALLIRAAAEQREALERLIARRWDDVRANADAADLREFAALFGPEFRVGREARFALGELLLKQQGTDSLPEAEQQFLVLARQREDVPLAARATDALARLCAAKGLLDDAVFWYRTLGRDFPNTAVRDGKTGADVLNDLATDRRFLPFLEDAERTWSGHKVTMKTEPGMFQLTQQLFAFEPGNDVVPYLQRRRLALETNLHQLRVIDRQTNEVQWPENLAPRTQFQMLMVQQQGTGAGPRFPYHTVGHTVVLNVGHMVFGLDPVNRKVRWSRSLAVAFGPAGGQVVLDPRDGTLQIVYPDGWVQRLGTPLTVGPGYVCLQTHDGLLALDPVTGETLWKRADVRPRSDVFGDDRHVYLVETGQEGTPTSTRAFGAADGVAVKDVPDFGAIFARRQRIDGGRILAADTKDNRLSLRLYDVPTGKDVWTKDCAAGALAVHCEDPHLAAVLEPDGSFTALDLRSAREVLKVKLDPQHVDKVQGASLVADAGVYYLLINGPRDANAPWNNGPWPNLMPGTGYRSLPLNGPIYAFDKQTGQILWQSMEIPAQMLVLEGFRDLPFLLLTSRSNKLVVKGANRWLVNSTALTVVDKKTGKLLKDERDLSNTQQFHAIHADPREGKVELISYGLKVTLTLTAEQRGDGNKKPPPKP